MRKEQERFLRLKQIGGKVYKSLHSNFSVACGFHPLLSPLVLSCPFLAATSANQFRIDSREEVQYLLFFNLFQRSSPINTGVNSY